jgi:hypothetical protein
MDLDEHVAGLARDQRREDDAVFVVAAGSRREIIAQGIRIGLPVRFGI